MFRIDPLGPSSSTRPTASGNNTGNNTGNEDAVLVDRARHGEANAFRALYQRHEALVRSVVAQVIRDAAAIEDIMQETFLSAWSRLETLASPAAFRGWLARIARNAAIDYVKSPARLLKLVPADEVNELPAPVGTYESDDPERCAEAAETGELFWLAAGALSASDVSMLQLHVLGQLQPVEIARATGRSRNAAKQLLHRLRMRLADSVIAASLWNRGAPVCADLANAIERAGISEFGPDTVRAIRGHARGCSRCEGLTTEVVGAY